MIEDKSNTRLFLSSLLPDWYPAFWEELKSALERKQIIFLPETLPASEPKVSDDAVPGRVV